MKRFQCLPGAPIVLASAVALGMFIARDASGTADTSGARTGAEIYQHICQGCHMPQGEGAVGAGAYPRLAGNAHLASWQYLVLTVLNGRAAMPSFGTPTDQPAAPRSAQLSDAEVAEIVNFVRTHFGNAYPEAVTAAQVKELPHPGVKGH